MSKRALITGVAGQDGTYLSELLVGKGYEVFGLVRTCERESAEQSCGPLGVYLIDGDLTDRESLLAAVQTSRPDEVYNLAGQSAVGLSWNEPALTAEVNSVGMARLLEVLRGAAPEARFFQASSAEIFGNPEHAPQDERTPIRPVTRTAHPRRTRISLSRTCVRGGVCSRAAGFSTTTNRRCVPRAS